ncbi:hypothetical protein BDQ17DRAFT_1341348 [Cyathus striatus]|nr:hypothetical protein BDQ17DRAFT_1341348 [Cyathus striatus]
MPNRPLSKEAPSVAQLDRNHLSRPDTSPSITLPLRSRGMTDCGPARRPSILSSRPTSRSGSSHKSISQVPVSPRVVVRQPSMSRIGSPPSAPPTHDLPATPLSPVKDQYADDEYVNHPGHASTSSSGLSFVYSLTHRKDLLVPESTLSPRQRDKRPPDRGLPFESDYALRARSKSKSSHSPPTSPRILKKASSQSSLGKRAALPSGSTLSPSTSDKASEKAPRKQRSFQIPLPPLPNPLRHANSLGPASPPVSESGSASLLDQRRGSAGSTMPTRKRLFSGSSLRRPSTSQCTPVDDDSQSIFSLRSDTDRHMPSSRFKTWTTQTPQPSFWEEASPDTMAATPIQDYVPQSIISAAEIAELEASMNANIEISSPQTRPRGLSIMSQSTMSSDIDTENQITSLPPPVSRSRVNTVSRTNSLLFKPSSVPPRVSTRPSTAQPNLSPGPDESFFRPSSSPPPIITSLPPPPRPRNRPKIITEPVHSSPLVTSLPPPPRRPVKPKMPAEKSLLRQSLMRKPSFLDIDDETDGDSDLEDAQDTLNGGSFLDLARESFDTFRSD